MKRFLHFGILELLFFIECVEAYYTVGAPANVTLTASANNIAVRWVPAQESNQHVQRYIASWAILPSFVDVSSQSTNNANVTTLFISIKEDIGRLFRVRVKAETANGMGNYSAPRYIRIECGYGVTVLPGSDVLVSSPGFNENIALKTGLMCKWHANTTSFYALKINIKYLDLYSDSGFLNREDRSCESIQTYLNISNVGLFCKTDDSGRTIVTGQSTLEISLITGLHAGGKGFSLVFTAVVKTPGPPAQVTTRLTDHAIVVAWRPPIEKTLPITSYILRYSVLPHGRAYRLVIGPQMMRFAVNTDKMEGKLLSFNITAVINRQRGEASRNVYARATCRRVYYLQPGQSLNISSPNYPHPYPDSIVCIWTIRCSPEATLHVTYYDFRLEDVPFCNRDYITFSYKREPECARIKMPHYYYTGLQVVNVTFVTDSDNHYQGFLINFAAKAVSDYQPAFPATTVFPLTLPITSTASSIFSYNIVKLTEKTPPENGSTSLFEANHSAFRSSSSTISSFASLSSNVLSFDTVSYHSSPSSTRPTLLTRLSSRHLSITSSEAVPTTVISSRRKLLSNTSFISEMSSAKVPFSSLKKSFLLSYSSPIISRVENSLKDKTSKQTISQSVSMLTTNKPNKVQNPTVGSGKALVSKDEGFTRKDFRDEGQKPEANILVPLLLSIAGILFVASIAVIFMWRRYKRRQKIDVSNGTIRRTNQIEMHDILLESKCHNNRNAIFKTMSSCDMFGKLQTRKRRSTFPLCYSKRRRKVHREIQREMAILGTFIEDKSALEERLRRRHAHRRTSSF